VGSGGGALMLRTRGAERRFGSREIFSGLDLDVPLGMRLLLTGGNGAGKTTLLRCLAGTLALTGGGAWVAGRRAGSVAARRLVGVCLTSEQGLYSKLTAHDNLMLVARLRLPGHSVTDAVAQVERELGIDSFAAIRLQQCSAGMRAKVAIGRALIGDPPVLLLDEPSRSLDEHAYRQLWAALDRRAGIACVMASHHEADRARCHDTLCLPVGR
jgi:ABC-2 type transport system ATP-binding protein